MSIKQSEAKIGIMSRIVWLTYLHATFDNTNRALGSLTYYASKIDFLRRLLNDWEVLYRDF